MKKIFIFVALALFPTISMAQRSIPRTDNVSVSSTIVTKTKHKRSIQLKKYDARIGYQQIVEANANVLSSSNGSYTNIGGDYIGGWRFNNWFFLGGGIGIHKELWPCGCGALLREYMDERIHLIGAGNDYSVSVYDPIFDATSYVHPDGSLNALSIPLYAHLRTYLSRTSFSPYLSMSLGGRLAPKDSAIYFDISAGLDYRINSKYHIFLSAGFNVTSYKVIYLETFSEYMVNSSSDYYNYDYNVVSYAPYEKCPENCEYSGGKLNHDHIEIYNLFKESALAGGLSVKLGLSF